MYLYPTYKLGLLAGYFHSNFPSSSCQRIFEGDYIHRELGIAIDKRQTWPKKNIRYDKLNAPNSSHKLVEDLHFAKERIFEDGFRGPLHYLSSRRTFNQSCKRARDYVSAYTTLQTKGRNNGEQNTDFQISLLIDQTLDIVIANDSMSTTLSGLFYCLAQEERVVHRPRESTLDTIGTSPPSWEQLGTLHYVRWVLQEGKP